MVRVLFVCLGNICRSPMAQAVFQRLVDDSGLSSEVEVDSAATGPWHVGEQPDPRAVESIESRGYEIRHLVGRQVDPSDFESFDYILAMDRTNLENLRQICPEEFKPKLQLVMDYAELPGHPEVPDPYGGGEEGFDVVFDLIDSAVRGLLRHIRQNNLQ